MVKAKTLQVVWHSKEPVYSVDFHPNGQLVTGGGDKEIKVWEVERGSDGYPSVRHVSSLSAHLKTVNCVRFSPTGTHLATSGDGGEVLLWEPMDAAAAAARRSNLCEDDGEASWRRCAAFKGHSADGDVMDLSWAPDGTALASGAIDNEAFLFVAAGRKRGDAAGRFKDHKHFVQGVAWDPAQQYVATLSADRTCKVYALKPPAGGRKNKVSQYLLPAGETARDFYCAHTLAKRPMPGPAAEGGKPASHPLFADERVNTFFRRPAWSPDGSLLVVPAGVYKAAPGGSELKTAYVYARGKWGAPIMHLPGHSKEVVVVRFCPVLFERDDGKGQQVQQPAEQQAQLEGEQPVQQQQQEQQQAGGGEAAGGLPIDLPYKMVFAVATLDSVVLYDTQSALPLAVLGHLHYDSITDLAWSSDGQYLAISSRDCYCSIAAFDAGELGKPLPAEQLPAHIAKRMAAAQRQAVPVAMAAPAARTAAAPSAAKAAATPSAAKAAVLETAGAAAAAEPASTARQQPEAAAAPAAPEPAAGAGAGRKRIQPEPILAAPAPTAGTAGGAAAPAPAPQPEEQPAAKKARRITPETVGPAPAVVGDSQQGGLEVPSYAEPAPAPSSAKPGRRIQPEPIGAPSGGPSSASGAPGTKPPRRIQPEPIGPLPGAAPPSAAKSSGLPAESAVSGKVAKRITPTPLHTVDSVGRPFSAAAANQATVSAQPAPSEMSRDGCPPNSARRITPVPVKAAQALPAGEERTASVAPKPSGIAALAAAMGAAAAHQRQQ